MSRCKHFYVYEVYSRRPDNSPGYVMRGCIRCLDDFGYNVSQDKKLWRECQTGSWGSTSMMDYFYQSLKEMTFAYRMEKSLAS